METPVRNVVAAGSLALLLAGCSETRYTPYDEAEKTGGNPLDRTVEFMVFDGFYRDPPTCVAVLPFRAEGNPQRSATVVEEALARHLSLRVSRVIGPREREGWVRLLAVDLERPADRVAFARGARCDHFVRARPWGDEGVFAVVWTQARVGLEIEMTRRDGTTPVWRGRHVATRSEGGLPLSPLSVIYNLVTVSSFSSDKDVPVSMVDDAVRRIVATLPDARMGPSTTTAYGPPPGDAPSPDRGLSPAAGSDTMGRPAVVERRGAADVR